MIFCRSWFDKGILTLNNLLDSEFNFLTYEQFKLRHWTNFWIFYGVINTIPRKYKEEGKRTTTAGKQLVHSNLGTVKGIHKIFEEPTAVLGKGVTADHISNYFKLAFSITKETKLTMFQYKVLHDIVFTKSIVFKRKMTSCDLCYLCQEASQSLVHMLYSCPVVSKFWDCFRVWYEATTHLKWNCPLLEPCMESLRIMTLIN